MGDTYSGAMVADVSSKHIPLLERLTKERELLQKKLDEYDEAIKSLEANPEFEKLINTLNRVSRIY